VVPLVLVLVSVSALFLYLVFLLFTVFFAGVVFLRSTGAGTGGVGVSSCCDMGYYLSSSF